MPITIIGARSLLLIKSLKLHKGNIKIIIDAPIDIADLHEDDKNKLLMRCPNVIIQNMEMYTSKYIYSNELYSV